MRYISVLTSEFSFFLSLCTIQNPLRTENYICLKVSYHWSWLISCSPPYFIFVHYLKTVLIFLFFFSSGDCVTFSEYFQCEISDFFLKLRWILKVRNDWLLCDVPTLCCCVIHFSLCLSLENFPFDKGITTVSIRHSSWREINNQLINI